MQSSPEILYKTDIEMHRETSWDFQLTAIHFICIHGIGSVDV